MPNAGVTSTQSTWSYTARDSARCCLPTVSSLYPVVAMESTLTSRVRECASLETTLVRVPGPKLTEPVSPDPSTVTRVVAPTLAAAGVTATIWASLARTASQTTPNTTKTKTNQRPD